MAKWVSKGLFDTMSILLLPFPQLLSPPSPIPLSFTLSYVSRRYPVDPKTHMILGVQQVKPTELADQMMLDVPNAWGVLHAIVDACLEQPEGRYHILKDPNQVKGLG